MFNRRKAEEPTIEGTRQKDSTKIPNHPPELSDKPKAHGASNSPKPNPKLNTDDGGNTTGSPTGYSLQNQKESSSTENKADTDINGKQNGDKTQRDDPPDLWPGNREISRPGIPRKRNTPYSSGIPKDSNTPPRAETQGESNINKQKDENGFEIPGTTITLKTEWVVAALLVLLIGNLYYQIYSGEHSNGKDCSCNRLFEKRIKSLETKVNTNTDRIDGLEKHTRRLDGEIERLEAVIERLDVKVNDRMNMIEHDIRTLSSILEVTENRLKQRMDSQNKELDGKIESQKEDLGEKIGKESKKSNSNLEASEKRLKSLNEDLEGKITAESDKLKKLHSLIYTFDERIRGAEYTVREKTGEIEERAKEMEEQMNDTAMRMKTMKERLTAHETDLDTAFANLFNKEVTMAVIVFLLVSDFGLIFAVYILCKGRSSDGSGTPGVRKKGPDGTFEDQQLSHVSAAVQKNESSLQELGTDVQKVDQRLGHVSAAVQKNESSLQELGTHVQKVDQRLDHLSAAVQKNESSLQKVEQRQAHVSAAVQKNESSIQELGTDVQQYNSVLDQIPESPHLQYSVGVISFSKEYEPAHKHLIESVTRLLQGVAVRYHVILNKGDIRDIPHCRLIVICVEHSDRDVIIEESGYGLGDTNKTTLAAVQKLGAIPVIIYCKDLRSQRLNGDSLFHPRIRCATQQKELQPLSSDGRFFSVYDDFSPKQTEVFKRLIMQHVKRNSS